MTDERTTKVNIVDWYMFLTFDILGDLGFGEAFNCLETSTYHPWVQTIFNYFKTAAFVGVLRIYFTMSIDNILMACIPKRVQQVSKAHYQWAVDKVHRRMNLETERDDIMSHILRHNDNGAMSTPEIENNTNVLIVAGSETCGTVLSGTTNYLTKSPEALRKLTEEVRSRFGREEDMTFVSLAELPYLNAVIAEGLRLCPPSSSGLSHVVPPAGDTVCGDWLPEGTIVSVHQWSLYRSRARFCRPDEFLPERWLPEAKADPSSPFFNDDLSAVQAFSVGIWSCIGKQLAYGELRVVLGRMVWNFDISVAARGRDVDWTAQKCWFLVEKEPFDVDLVDVR
ncbi:MAG: hypothetical protein Q9202_001910 [Teloschistes flavicans]